MSKTKTPQSGKAKIKSHLKAGKSLTSKQAEKNGWSKSLPKRISEIEKEGFKIIRAFLPSNQVKYSLDLKKTPKKLLK